MKLIANRKAFPIRTEYVDALNKIDVIFQDNTKVRDAWKIYFDSLHPQSPKNANAPTYQIELLSEIAKDLNYKNLTPSELVNFYSPQQFENELYINAQIQNELLRVLTKSQSFSSDVED